MRRRYRGQGAMPEDVASTAQLGEAATLPRCALRSAEVTALHAGVEAETAAWPGEEPRGWQPGHRWRAAGS